MLSYLKDSSNKTWVRTELKGSDIGYFKEYLREMKIIYETSEMDHGYVHFECLMSENEIKKANAFLERM